MTRVGSRSTPACPTESTVSRECLPPVYFTPYVYVGICKFIFALHTHTQCLSTSSLKSGLNHPKRFVFLFMHPILHTPLARPSSAVSVASRRQFKHVFSKFANIYSHHPLATCFKSKTFFVPRTVTARKVARTVTHSRVDAFQSDALGGGSERPRHAKISDIDINISCSDGGSEQARSLVTVAGVIAVR